MTDSRSRLLDEIECDPSYATALVRVRAARETAALLRGMRKGARLTQAELGKKLGVSQARISHVESGLLDHLPPIDFVYLYAGACGSTVSLRSSAEQEQETVPASQYLVIIDRRALDRECLIRAFVKHGIGIGVLGFRSLEEWKLKRELHSQPAAILLPFGGRKLIENSARLELKGFISELGDVPVIVMADSDEPAEIVAALEAGARGYIPTSVEVGVAAEAIGLVRAGGIFVPASSILALREAFQSTANPVRPLSSMFTAREAAVAEAIRKGKANKIIAYELNLAENTVKIHIRNIMTKLKATNRTEIAYKIDNLLSKTEPHQGKDKLRKPALRS